MMSTDQDRPTEMSRPAPEVRFRDLEKIREKQPVWLEPRQVLLAVLLVAIGLVLAFAAGWWTRGRRPALCPEHPPVPSPVCRCPIVASPTTVPEVPARVVRSQVLPQPAEVEARDVEPPPGPPARRAPDDPPSPPPPPSPAPEIAVAPPPATPTVPAPDPAEAHSPVPTDAPPSPMTRASRPPDTGSPGASEAPVPLSQRRWSIQVRAYRDPQLAEEYAATLKKRGYHARVVTGRDSQGTPWYRIHVGRFTTAAEAHAFAGRFNRREGEKAIAVEGP